MMPAPLGTIVLLTPAPVVVLEALSVVWPEGLAVVWEEGLSVVWLEVPLVAPPAGAMLSGAAFAPVV